MRLKGSLVALVTPMTPEGPIDDEALDRLIALHLDAGTSALVIAGTTGESPTLEKDEHVRYVARARELADGRIPVIAGTGSNSTRQTLELSREVAATGVDALMLVVPYYNKPPQEGLYRHFATVADAVDLPIVLYNVPGRTACDLLPETVARLAEIDNVVALKEAKAELERVARLRELCGPAFALLSGDDATSREFMREGGDGVISVTANVAPAVMQAMCEAALAGRSEEAAEIDARLADLHRTLFLEANPIPVKWALERMGLIQAGIRLPLTRLTESYHVEVEDAMRKAGVLDA